MAGTAAPLGAATLISLLICPAKFVEQRRVAIRSANSVALRTGKERTNSPTHNPDSPARNFGSIEFMRVAKFAGSDGFANS